MKNLYIIFEQLPNPQSGGLITMLKTTEKVLMPYYNIKIISVFNCNDENKKQFLNDIIVLNKYIIDNRFFKLKEYLKNKKMRMFIHGILSMIIFFVYIPFAKKKIASILNKEDKVIVASPAAGIFMTKKHPFILEIHGKYDFFWSKRFISKLQIKIMSKPALILFRNKSDACKAQSLYNSSYIYNAFDNKNIVLCKDWQKKVNKFLFIGRLSLEKNPLKLVDIAKMVVIKNPNIKIDIYGQGPLENEIKNKIIEYRLENNVFLKGYVNDKNIYSQYSALLLTSESEGFPLTIIEAKANGIPVISTRWGEAVVETISHGKDGFIVKTNQEFAQYMLQLTTDIELLKEMSNNSYIDFKRFSVQEYTNKYRQYLESV